jgi:hypothetical protein
MQPRLIVTIDTEEEGLWKGTFRAQGNTVENIKGVVRFQELCDRYQVRPTYLIDTPVVDDDYAAGLFRSIQETDRCEVGAHLHPWCAPPFVEELSQRNSFLCNLPEELQREKLWGLTDRIAARIGRTPTSFRAGRYGLGLAGARILKDLGFVVDSSVIPFSEFTGEGGPDFRSAPFLPYLIGEDGLALPDPRGFLLEVPVSVGFSRANFEAARRWRDWGLKPVPRRLRAVGILDRLGIARRIKFSPEQSSAARMRQLVSSYIRRNAPCMVMMFHSTSLVAGASPYVRDGAALERFYESLEAMFEYCLTACRMVPSTLTRFAEDWYQAAAAPSNSGHLENVGPLLMGNRRDR